MTDVGRLTAAFAERHPYEFAQAARHGDSAELCALLARLPAAAAAAVLVHLPAETAAHVSAELEPAVLADWLAAAPLDVAVRLLWRLGDEHRDPVLAELSDARLRRLLSTLVLYPRRTVGALVDARIIAVSAQSTVADVVASLRRLDDAGADVLICVTDADARYLGAVDLPRALAAEPGTLVDRCLDAVTPLRAEMSMPSALDAPGWLERTRLPVVDGDQRLLGSMARRTLLEAVHAERPAEEGFAGVVLTLAGRFLDVSGQLLMLVLGRPIR